MSVLHEDIPDDVLRRFYAKARAKFGEKKGYKKSALLAAIESWINNKER